MCSRYTNYRDNHILRIAMHPLTTSEGKLQHQSFLLLLLGVTVLFSFLVKPFFAPVFWAGVTSLLFYPVQLRLRVRWGDKPNLIAFTTLILCIVLAIIPMMLILMSFVEEGANLYDKLDSGEIDPDEVVDQVQSALPFLKDLLNWLGLDMDSLKEQTTSGALAASSFAAKNVMSLGRGTFKFFLNLGLMLYLTFFLLRDGARLVNLVSRALPLGLEREGLLVSKFAKVTRATVKGNLVVAAVQGALGGLIFWILDIPAPVLWSVAIAVVSLIPAIGASLVWLPFALFLFATDRVGSALILIAYGVIAIGLADNILRPILVGRDTRLPDWLVLLSTLGGLVMFGIQGFVIGPLIAALFLVVWQIFSRDYNDDELLVNKQENAEEGNVLPLQESSNQVPASIPAPVPSPAPTS